MKAAIELKTRALVPLSPEALRLPRKASASSMMTATGHIAFNKLNIFSRLPSVTPCHCERKLRNFTQGIPISPAKQVARKVLPVPIGPAIRKPIGTTSRLPVVMARAACLRSCFAFPCPATMSMEWAGSMNSSSPWHSAWMISFFFSLSRSTDSFGPAMASVSTRSSATRDMPAVICASASALTSEISLRFFPLAPIFHST